MVHFDPLVKKMSGVNHLSGPLRKGKFSSTGSKGHCLWFVIGGFRSVFWVSVFQGSLLVIFDQNPTLIFQILLIDFIPGLQTSKFRWGKNTAIQIKFWDRKSAIKCRASFLSHMPLTLYKTFAWHTFASLRLFTCLVYVSTYCVPIAHLRQNKPFPLPFQNIHKFECCFLRVEVSSNSFWVFNGCIVESWILLVCLQKKKNLRIFCFQKLLWLDNLFSGTPFPWVVAL